MSKQIQATKDEIRIKRCLVCGKRLPRHPSENLCVQHRYAIGEMWQLDTINWIWRKIEKKR